MKGNGDIKKYFDALNDRFDALNSRFDGLNSRFDGLNSRFDGMDKRFDALNKRLDAFEKRVDEKFEAVDQRFDRMEERLDALTAEVGDLKLKVESLNLLTTDMQRVQHILVKDVAEIKVRVDRLEDGQKRIIVLITKLGERMSDFDSGKKFELTEVRHDEASRSLTGIIREPKTPYKVKKRKRKR